MWSPVCVSVPHDVVIVRYVGFFKAEKVLHGTMKNTIFCITYIYEINFT